MSRAVPPLEEVGRTPGGHTIFREPNGCGGYRYWSDAIGGGVVIWDTCLASIEELMTAIRIEMEARANRAKAEWDRLNAMTTENRNRANHRAKYDRSANNRSQT